MEELTPMELLILKDIVEDAIKEMQKEVDAVEALCLARVLGLGMQTAYSMARKLGVPLGIDPPLDLDDDDLLPETPLDPVDEENAD